MPNWYVAADGLEAENIKTTTEENLKFVAKFDTKEKWKRSMEDMYNPFTPKERLEQSTVKQKEPGPGSIIPTPVEIKEPPDKSYVDVSGWTIVTLAEFEDEAKYLGKKLQLPVTRPSAINTKILRLLQQNVDVKVNEQGSTSRERYQVDVKKDIITISAPGPSGIFYGIQSLLAVTEVKTKQVLKVRLLIFRVLLHSSLTNKIAEKCLNKNIARNLRHAL